MSPVMFFILSCLMTLCILTRTEASDDGVRHPDWQCRAAKHVTACYGYSHEGDVIDCKNLKCVGKGAMPRDDGKYPGIPIGKADDGTYCAVNMICKNGVCTEMRKNQRLPSQYGYDRDVLRCYDPQQ